MLKKPQEPWNEKKDNLFTRFISGIDFSVQVLLSTGVVLLLCVMFFLIARDRFQTVNYLLAAVRT